MARVTKLQDARRSAEIKVFISTKDSKCDECGEQLGRQTSITLVGDQGALCLACADLDGYRGASMRAREPGKG